MGALLKLYQLNPTFGNMKVVVQILLKSLTNLPHTDFVLCKCLLSQELLEDAQITNILYLADLLEMCQFKVFWAQIHEKSELVQPVTGFVGELLGLVQDSSINYWMEQYGWKTSEDGFVTVSNQEEIIKTRNITEKIDIESVASIMASCY